MRRNLLFAVAAVLGSLVCLHVGTATTFAGARSFPSVSERQGVLTFKLRGLKGARVESAKIVGRRGKTLRVSVRRVQRATRRGVLRVAIPRSWRLAASRAPREAARAAHHGRGGHRLTVVTDTTPPETAISSGPSGAVSSTSVSFGFSSSESSSTFECRLDASSWAACSSPKAYSGLTDGSHTFNVRAKDAAGNIDASPASRTFTVDVAPPYSVSASPTSVSSGQSITASWKVTGDTSTTDWVGIFKQSEASDGNALGEWYYTDGAKTASKTFTAPTTAGTYELRYFRNDGWEVSARSGPITVTAASSSSSPPPAGGYFATVLTGQFDYTITDAQAAAKVRRSSWEPRPQNQTANNTVAPADFAKPNDGWGSNWDKTYGRITGNFTGTTDEIIQWVAAKWGIEDEIIRAMLMNETNWYQNHKDADGVPIRNHGYSDYGHCPPARSALPTGMPDLDPLGSRR